MVIEYNLSHEETVAGWDLMIRESFPVFEKLIKTYKNDFIICQDGGYISIDIPDLRDFMHKSLHNIIEFQKEKYPSEAIINSEFLKILSYCILALWLNNEDDPMMPIFNPKSVWEARISSNRELMIKKNKNYGSSWSIMRPEGITDTIHTKIHRISSLLDGEKNNFESINDSLEDTINYCIFCMMRMKLGE